MCGIVGIVAHEDVNQNLYDALTVLQHRGQDAAGIMTCAEDRVSLRKSNGMGSRGSVLVFKIAHISAST